MMAIRRPCIVATCAGFAVGGRRGARCAECQVKLNRVGNTDPRRVAYRDPAYTSWRYPKGTPCALRMKDICTGIATTRDHVIPLSRGGTNHPSNLQPACRACNSAKRDRTV